MKRIFVIATGGTIAGVGKAGDRRYRSGELGVGDLLASVPGLGAEIEVTAHQFANIGSQNMSEHLWFELASLVREKLQGDDCDGVVILHGTDSLEETAFFLHCVLPPAGKPVVLTGAMRPATALSPDGPHNLFAAICTAASDASARRGVLVVFDNKLFSATAVFKRHTQDLDAFGGGEHGVLGRVNGAQVLYHAAETTAQGDAFSGSLQTAPICGLLETPADRIDWHTLLAAGSLPKVALVTAHVGQLPEQVEALVSLGYRGIVYAGFGNGNFSTPMLAALKAAQAAGVVVVRASRVPLGGVVEMAGEAGAAEHGFICSGELSPQKARILLSLALLGGDDPQQIRNWFSC